GVFCKVSGINEMVSAVQMLFASRPERVFASVYAGFRRFLPWNQFAVPLKAMEMGRPAVVSPLICRVALFGPLLIGAKDADMVHEEFGASEPPQLLEVVNSDAFVPVSEIELMLRAPPPELVSVTV